MYLLLHECVCNMEFVALHLLNESGLRQFGNVTLLIWRLGNLDDLAMDDLVMLFQETDYYATGTVLLCRFDDWSFHGQKLSKFGN